MELRSRHGRRTSVDLAEIHFFCLRFASYAGPPEGHVTFRESVGKKAERFYIPYSHPSQPLCTPPGPPFRFDRYAFIWENMRGEVESEKARWTKDDHFAWTMDAKDIVTVNGHIFFKQSASVRFSVRPGKASVFSRSQSCYGKSQKPYS